MCGCWSGVFSSIVDCVGISCANARRNEKDREQVSDNIESIESILYWLRYWGLDGETPAFIYLRRDPLQAPTSGA